MALEMKGRAMTATETQFTIGSEARCSDGICGEISRVVVDPVAKAGREDVAIPIDSVTSVDDGIRLKISKQQVKDLPPEDVDHTDY